jgi:hypothetical protein
MKRVTPGEPLQKNPVPTGTYKLTQNPGELISRGFADLAFIHRPLRYWLVYFQLSASNRSALASRVNPRIALDKCHRRQLNR